MLNICEPTLLLNEAICKANIQRMADKAKASGARFRPHFKTHQSLAIGEWFREAGVEAIAVSSVKMAHYFSTAWRDITIAVPFNIREIDRVNRIRADCQLNLCVLSVEVLEFLEQHVQRDVGIWIKIDAGYHRTGLQPDDPEIRAIAGYLKAAAQRSGKLALHGLLAHAGHTYNMATPEDIRAVDRESRALMQRLKASLADDWPDLQISLGDTPACSIVDNFRGIDELRPGNLVFYDLQQHLLGACGIGDIAVAMACPVIARHEHKLIIHGGGVHFSKDNLVDKADNQAHYGWVLGQPGDDWSTGWGQTPNGLRLTALSQEHGTVTGPQAMLDRYAVGDLVLILPVHSCLTAHEMKGYTTLDGKRLLHLEAEYPVLV